jgi:hypothetical protein
MVFAGVGSARADEVLQARQILSYFGSSCPSQGEWTSRAISQAESLIDTLRSLRDDADCKTLAGSIGQLQILNQRIQTVARRPKDSNLYVMKRKQENLLLQLSAATSDAEREMITTALKQLQSDIAIAEATSEVQASNQKTEDFGSALQNLVTGTGLLMNQAVANQSCLMKRPSILSGIAALSGSVYAALASSGTSLAVAAGVELLSTILESIRRSAITKQMEKFNESILFSAYSCVLESLSGQWCAAQDSLNIISLRARPISPSDPLVQGMRMLDFEMPNVLKWLEFVRAGAEPATSADALRIKGVNQTEEVLKSARVIAIGALNEEKTNYANAIDDDSRWAVVKNLVASLVSQFSNSGRSLFEVYNSDYAPYYLLGFSEDQLPKYTDGRIIAFEMYNAKVDQQWPATVEFPPQLDKIKPRISNWIALAERRAAIERVSITQPDPLVIFYDAITSPTSGSIKGVSPLESVKKLYNYLSTSRPEKLSSDVQKQLYVELTSALGLIVEKISDAEESVRASTEAGDLRLRLLKVLDEISAATKLENRGIFEARLNRAVAISLQNLLVSGQSGLSPSEAAQYLAADDIIKDLLQLSAQNNISYIKFDLENSQRLTQSTLQVFYEIFHKNLDQVLKKYKEAANRERKSNSPSRLYRNALAQFCLLLLSIPEAKGLDQKACYDELLEPLWPTAPASAPISADTFKLELQDRACLMRNYFRAQKIYQDYSDSLAGMKAADRVRASGVSP